ncbi:MAG: metallophosphoesterase [Pseudomonadota bacterium]
MGKNSTTLVVSDFHLGAGPTLPDGSSNFLEDFFHDPKLVQFLDHYSTGANAKREVALVVNGDFFNHLQVFPDESKPELLTVTVALKRTQAIVDGHKSVFDALSRFAAAPNHSITFMIGNHDLGLFWPKVQDYIHQVVGQNVKIHTASVYLKDGIWIEHGNQQVAENRLDYEHPFVTMGVEKPLVKLPWGDFFVLRFLNRMKRDRPYVDKVYPFRLYLRWALIHDTWFAIKASFAGLKYFLQVLLGIGDNKQLGRKQFLKIIKEFSFPVRMDLAAKRIFALHPEVKVVVFGHGHRAASVLFAGGKQYFNTGIWNEMISLDLGTMGRMLRLTFVEIGRDKQGMPIGRLMEWKGVQKEVEEVEAV